MNKFILVTSLSGLKVRQNLSFVESYWSDKEGRTVLAVDDGTMTVKESPEEIDKMVFGE